MAETKATATKGAATAAPKGDDQAAQDAAKLAAELEQKAAAEQEAIDAAKAAEDHAAQEEAEKAEAERIAALEAQAQEAIDAETARLQALGENGAPNFDHAAIVIVPFRDKDDFTKEYKVGDDVSDFEEDRLLDVIEKGLVELQGEAEAE